jgi:hypothetical protein
MNWRAIVPAGISQAIGQCGLSRQGLIRILASVHIDLPAHSSIWRKHRDPTDSDFFLYPVGLREDGAFHMFEFQVNDVSAPGFLFIARMRHSVY